MTYLSRIRINPLRAESRRLLSNPRALHGAVMGGLPGAADSERTLWRLDADNPHRPQLFVLTRSKPDWTHIVEQAGWPDADGEHAAVRDYEPLLDQIATGREFAFRLTANPVQNTASPTKPTSSQRARLDAMEDDRRARGFRLAHRTAAAQLDWFLARTERWGFAVPDARTDTPVAGLADAPPPEEPNSARDIRIIDRSRHTFTKGGRGPRVTFHSATYEGRLRITDPALFTTRLLEGIGPSKAYGCGLLTLAPLPGSG
ncbi:type I-E CRISPR-associated protein Cas6/Cse3/CasE [Streptomyces albipurpureus]|uniref:Type I-E CRISPR-associated protein Cas6/Cse3/CasE n=1 Tax=Streptomyces albipurpureus TaxID=2897419 RepID=A0ABT0UX48_9ACTN|nr:type I-E CRISPR-associated protein Cas6/Cse3/CasE [Streptomyces sp. CWNU-1]MCM2393029.1 type I-E CRISPR-associated protein Cas6/Cse3/CasE [Streptomyces sp. CWNU-1]